MTWNHRVLAKEYEGELEFGIHECYYNDDGVPEMCTENPVAVVGDNLAELVQTLDWMRKSLRQPILSYTDFEEGGKYWTGNPFELMADSLSQRIAPLSDEEKKAALLKGDDDEQT